MALWRVPVTISHSEEYDQLRPEDVSELALSLPGGGIGSSGGDDYVVGPRKFTKTLEVESDGPGDAESTAKDQIQVAIDQERFPGWSASSTGEAALV